MRSRRQASGGTPFDSGRSTRTAAAARRLGLATATPAWVLACAAGSPLAAIMATRTRGLVRGATVLAPADGVIASVDRTDNGCWAIATFMRPHDVHVNRAPCDGVVRALTHHAGSYRPAFSKASESNERMSWSIQSAHGELELSQIAGLAVRRIVAYRRVGDRVAKGERIGMIRFGSRVAVVMPAGIEPSVSVGDRVRAGVTALGFA
jgi:phosphatidylserine decarboxylase